MYQWRGLTPTQREELLGARVRCQHLWHRPPHFENNGPAWYHLTGACYEHAPHIGHSSSRMTAFAEDLQGACIAAAATIAAWSVLPNHYHLLLQTEQLRTVTAKLGRLHGRCSRTWNCEESAQGRTVFHGSSDRHIRSDKHFWAALNYVHHNPVRHGYVERWTEWPWSSAADYLGNVGHKEAARIWREFPVFDFGRGWDEPAM